VTNMKHMFSGAESFNIQENASWSWGDY